MDKTCMQCGAVIKGRRDKKFCDDNCRSIYNNLRSGESSAYMKRVNYLLRKNRNILAANNPEGKGKISRKRLLAEGFDFGYHTNTYTNKDGKTYYFCYEQGYLPIENDWYFLVVRKET